MHNFKDKFIQNEGARKVTISIIVFSLIFSCHWWLYIPTYSIKKIPTLYTFNYTFRERRLSHKDVPLILLTLNSLYNTILFLLNPTLEFVFKTISLSSPSYLRWIGNKHVGGALLMLDKWEVMLTQCKCKFWSDWPNNWMSTKWVDKVRKNIINECLWHVSKMVPWLANGTT